MDLSALLDWNFLLRVIDLDGGPWQRPAFAFVVLVFFLVLRRLLTHWMLWPLLGGLSRLLRLERSRIDGILRDPATLMPIAAGINFAARILQLAQASERPIPARALQDHRDPGSEALHRVGRAAPFRDWVVRQAFCAVFEPVFERGFIHDSYANRKDRGTHRAIARYEAFRDRFRYVLRCDFYRLFRTTTSR